MLDPARMDEVLRRGNPDVATLVATWRSADERRRKLQGELDSLRQERNAANEKMAKLDKKGIKGFILDLRFNPGGLLTSAVEISDLFIDDGLIVTIRPRGVRCRKPSWSRYGS